MILDTGHILTFSIGDEVSIVHDPEGYVRLIKAIILLPEGGVTYLTVCGAEEIQCFANELEKYEEA